MNEMTTFIQNRLNKLLGKDSRFKIQTQGQGQGQQEEKEETINKLTVEEESLNFFSKIYGYDDLKFNVYLALTSPKQMNTLLCGPPASAKSLFLKIIEENCEDVIFFDASNASSAGFIEVLYANQNAKIILIDEIGMLKKNDLDALRGLLNDGRIVKTLKKKNYDIRMENIKVFATTNDLNMPKPILSRFMVYQIPQYTDEEFVKVSQHCLKGEILPETAEILANVLIANKMKDLRKLIYVAGSIRRNFGMNEVVKVVETMIKYKQLAKEVDYN